MIEPNVVSNLGLSLVQGYKPPAGLSAVHCMAPVEVGALAQLPGNPKYTFWLRDGEPVMPLRTYGETTHGDPWVIDGAGTYWTGGRVMLPRRLDELLDTQHLSMNTKCMALETPRGVIQTIDAHDVYGASGKEARFFMFAYLLRNEKHFVARNRDGVVVGVGRDREDTIDAAVRWLVLHPRRVEIVTAKSSNRETRPDTMAFYQALEKRAGKLEIDHATLIARACLEIED